MWGSSCVPTLIQPCSVRVRKFSASYLPTILPRLCQRSPDSHGCNRFRRENETAAVKPRQQLLRASSPRTAACPASSERLPGEPEEAASPGEAPSAPPAYIHRCLLRGFRPSAALARFLFYICRRHQRGASTPRSFKGQCAPVPFHWARQRAVLLRHGQPSPAVYVYVRRGRQATRGSSPWLLPLTGSCDSALTREQKSTRSSP